MPKKTKKAKLIAEYRRKLQSLHSAQTPTQSLPSHELFTLPVVTPNIPKSQTVLLPDTESQAIRKDLIKTLVIVSLFIVFEFFLAQIL